MMAPGGAPSTVLLIDDERSLRLPLRLALERSGYVVLEAGDGQQGLELSELHRDVIAVAVVDHHMPRLSGLEVVQALHRRTHRPGTILMSGISEQDAGITESVADVFLRKPFHLIELVRTVRRLVETGRQATA